MKYTDEHIALKDSTMMLKIILESPKESLRLDRCIFIKERIELNEKIIAKAEGA